MNPKQWSPWFLLVWLCCMPWLNAAAEELASDARIHKKFILLPGKVSDPYLIHVPFQVTRPGRVRVYTEITGADVKMKHPGYLPNYILVDARAFESITTPLWTRITRDIVDKWPTLKLEAEAVKILSDVAKDLLRIKDDKPKWYHGGRDLLDKSKDSMMLDVDQRDLGITEGRYVLILRNPSPGEYHGNVLISYPGEDWLVDPALEALDPRKPDLAVEGIELDPDNRVLVTVSNRGPGWLPRVRYNPNAARVIRLSLELDGREVSSVPLATLDKHYALSLKGTVTYRSEVLLSGPANVTAIIDADEVVAEPDERNNRKRVSLVPKTTQQPNLEPGRRYKRDAQAGTPGTPTADPGLPDLTVTEIALDPRRRVTVRLLNQGAGLKAEDYSSSQPIQLRVLFNGRGWATVPLPGFDPERGLKRTGGSVLWVSDLILPETGEVTVIIDEGNRCQESDETNNTLTRRLLR